MKKLLLGILLLFAGTAALAQRTGVREEVLSDWNKSSGLDCVYHMSGQSATAAPRGYEPVYIGHYGRHGSRYAYTEKAYTVLLEMLTEARKQDNLTPFGTALLERALPFWENVRYRVGDLTPLGWEQHQYIAATMVKSFPTVFGKGSRVDACSSPAVRSIISMASCCAALSRLAPKAEIYAHQGILDIQATRPMLKQNPFRYKGPELVFPYAESSEAFFLRRFPEHQNVLSRLFKDPSAALGSLSAWNAFFNIYMFVAGMNSLPEEYKIDVQGVFTPEEFAAMWEADNYERFREYFFYTTANSAIVDDIIEKADSTLAAGGRGAHLRFGHDHVLMSLLLVLDLDGFATVPAKNDDLVYWFQTFRSPKAGNLQFVFYQPRKGRKGETLVKVLLNGEEARLGGLAPVSGPYYSWEAAKAYLKERIALFVN